MFVLGRYEVGLDSGDYLLTLLFLPGRVLCTGHGVLCFITSTCWRRRQAGPLWQLPFHNLSGVFRDCGREALGRDGQLLPVAAGEKSQLSSTFQEGARFRTMWGAGAASSSSSGQNE